MTIRETTMLMDFAEPELHDDVWAINSAPSGRVLFVEPKNNSNTPGSPPSTDDDDILELAVGEGRNGTNALKITCPTADSWMPNWWLKVGIKSGASVQNPSDDTGYLLPRGRRANYLNMWIKYPTGFRATSSADLAETENHQCGTYHFAPGAINGVAPVVESDGWHHYMRTVIRHAEAGNDWVHLKWGQQSGHLRGINQWIPYNWQEPEGGMWETATRLYFDSVPYWDPPEISHPYYALVDSIYFTYEDEYKPIEIQIGNYRHRQDVYVDKSPTVTQWTVTMTNTTNESVSGIVSLRAYSYISAQLLRTDTLASVNNTTITFTANETKQYYLRIQPADGTYAGNQSILGVNFTPSAERSTPITSSTLVRSKNDSRVCVNNGTFGYYGSDSSICAANLLLKFEGTAGRTPPWGQGGQTYRCFVNNTLNGSLNGHSASGHPLTFSLISQDSSASGVVSLNSNGTFTFTPANNYLGKHFFRWKVNDGISDSINFGSWIWVTNLPQITVFGGNKIILNPDGTMATT